ncbi:response regulator [Marinobacter zhejiangensis]|uniref:Response regulator receiver domain-containing protein n=1 Tax=Marinobacter zhejiangensis TaxID=488535 RepID=A0A1I4R8V7_9GAMM|nr:response regulator [Marinobacter zhejiangensis]SFM48649.1 Response regulator receiver domain-containing protein [Marinobacter zhejiangensis]
MSRGHALIVDDSSTARIMLSRLLERADLTTSSVASAEEAFPLLAKNSFDIIFLDHLLPGMNGFEALKKLKGQPETKGIPVFMYTSQNAERYRREAKTLGAAGVVGKQIDRAQLLRTLDGILDSAALTEPAAELSATSPAPWLADVSQQSANSLFGRMSTLEVAFEENDEELTSLRHSVSALQKQFHEELHSQRAKLRMISFASFASVVLLLSLVVWQSRHLSQLEDHVSQLEDQVDEQMSLLHRIVAGMVELIEKEP